MSRYAPSYVTTSKVDPTKIPDIRHHFPHHRAQQTMIFIFNGYLSLESAEHFWIDHNPVASYLQRSISRNTFCGQPIGEQPEERTEPTRPLAYSALICLKSTEKLSQRLSIDFKKKYSRHRLTIVFPPGHTSLLDAPLIYLVCSHQILKEFLTT